MLFFFFNYTATTEIYTLSLHDALPIWARGRDGGGGADPLRRDPGVSYFHRREPCRGNRKPRRSEEHTSELQSLRHLVCRLLLEKKKKKKMKYTLRQI